MEQNGESDNDRERLNELPVAAPDLNDEADHVIICPSCGQAFDCRKLATCSITTSPGMSRWMEHIQNEFSDDDAPKSVSRIS